METIFVTLLVLALVVVFAFWIADQMGAPWQRIIKLGVGGLAIIYLVTHFLI